MAKKLRTEFKDSKGNDVKVGDTLQALYPNARLGTMEVLALEADASLKPFIVRFADGTRGNANPSWVERI